MNEPTSADKNRRLGRGLGALIGGATATSQTPVVDRLRDIPVELIEANPYQPRRSFDDEEMRELEESLRANGLLQPIAVRPRGTGFELIAGERRFRAARRLGWPSIPAIIRDTTETEHLVLALVENLQRENLNPIDEAAGYRQLVDEFGYSPTQVAAAVGKERSTVANILRLLNLPNDVQQLVRSGDLSLGHARALLALPNEASIVETARQVVARQLTVRDVERLAQQGAARPGKTRRSRSEDIASAPTRQIRDRLRRYLQTDVQLVADESARGEVRIRFYSADDLARLLELIIGPEEDTS